MIRKILAATTYEDLGKVVDERGGVITAEMALLRNVHGAGKLGAIVVTAIHEQLESHGLGHAPGDLPTFQWERVIIYRKGTPVARVIEAIIAVNDRSDTILRESIGASGEARAIIQKIRELVCD